ncbi:MAG: UDP-N-acetylmuramate--L-alanine ligase [Candidatus Eremiobacteraeota bacterium]|nr:UDP-N-acetylmuramate--L-alanine ligase [Candidatus Eremiobacteraeota bacterium]
MTESINLNDVKHIHLIAICGTAMGALAGMLKKKGFRITGSDEGVYPPMSDYLRDLGIEVMEGFRSENLDVNPDLVIVGNTVKRINPEAQEMVRRNIPHIHLPGALSEYFLKLGHPIVISGTHGKTTTTALCAWVLESAGLDPGFLVGGTLKNFNSNAKVGEGKFFAIEGDEYDSAYYDKVPKFYHYRPKTGVITSVEFDHGDIYKDIDHIKSVFTNFANLIPHDGYLVACADFPHVLDVIKPAKCEIVTYGLTQNADIRIRDLELDENGAKFSLFRKDEKISDFRSPLWGSHNASNAAAVAIVCLRHGLSIAQIQEGFDTFQGVKRRQEILAVVNDIIMIDDFAHHPTKVRETVKAVRARYPDRRLFCVYEPRTNTSRRNFFQDVYPISFYGADFVLIAPVYHSDQIEKDSLMDPGKLAGDIRKKGIEAHHLAGVDDIIEFLAENTKSGDVILIMSNGGFGGIYKKLPQRLAKNKDWQRKRGKIIV